MHSAIPVALTCVFNAQVGQPSICHTCCTYLSLYSTGGTANYLLYWLRLPVILLHRWDSHVSAISVAITCHFTPQVGQPSICHTCCTYLSFYSTDGTTKYLPYLLVKAKWAPVFSLQRWDSWCYRCKEEAGVFCNARCIYL